MGKREDIAAAHLMSDERRVRQPDFARLELDQVSRFVTVVRTRSESGLTESLVEPDGVANDFVQGSLVEKSFGIVTPVPTHGPLPHLVVDIDEKADLRDPLGSLQVVDVHVLAAVALKLPRDGFSNEHVPIEYRSHDSVHLRFDAPHLLLKSLEVAGRITENLLLEHLPNGSALIALSADHAREDTFTAPCAACAGSFHGREIIEVGVDSHVFKHDDFAALEKAANPPRVRDRNFVDVVWDCSL
jgi:hypothetical protein